LLAADTAMASRAGGAGQRALFVHGDEQLEGDQVEAADQAFLQHGKAR
jgi:hypothetical protein